MISQDRQLEKSENAKVQSTNGERKLTPIILLNDGEKNKGSDSVVDGQTKEWKKMRRSGREMEGGTMRNWLDETASRAFSLINYATRAPIFLCN
jgi:hypothetical protein